MFSLYLLYFVIVFCIFFVAFGVYCISFRCIWIISLYLDFTGFVLFTCNLFNCICILSLYLGLAVFYLTVFWLFPFTWIPQTLYYSTVFVFSLFAFHCIFIPSLYIDSAVLYFTILRFFHCTCISPTLYYLTVFIFNVFVYSFAVYGLYVWNLIYSFLGEVQDVFSCASLFGCFFLIFLFLVLNFFLSLCLLGRCCILYSHLYVFVVYDFTYSEADSILHINLFFCVCVFFRSFLSFIYVEVDVHLLERWCVPCFLL